MKPTLPIYMDHNATTYLDRRVFEAMRPFFMETFGNAASRSHSFGAAAHQAVDHARQQVANLINALPTEIIWTSGSTESNNLAIKGAADMYRDKGKHLITQVTEHKAVLDPYKRLERDGYEITWLGVDRHGRIDVNELAGAIRPDTILVSIMTANNEIGTLQSIREIGALCKERKVLFHTDATQAIGKVPIDVQTDGIDLLSLSGHKLYGPKGCGVLYVRSRAPRVRLTPIFDGGGHESGFRSGTLNVPGIVGIGMACEIASSEIHEESRRLAMLRDRLQAGIMRRIEGVTVNGDERHRLPNTTNLSFPGVNGQELLASMNDIAVSSGSACTSASMEPSYVLRAIGVEPELAYASIRFSLGQRNTEADVDYVVNAMPGKVGRPIMARV